MDFVIKLENLKSIAQMVGRGMVVVSVIEIVLFVG